MPECYPKIFNRLCAEATIIMQCTYRVLLTYWVVTSFDLLGGYFVKQARPSRKSIRRSNPSAQDEHCFFSINLTNPRHLMLSLKRHVLTCSGFNVIDGVRI